MMIKPNQIRSFAPTAKASAPAASLAVEPQASTPSESVEISSAQAPPAAPPAADSTAGAPSHRPGELIIRTKPTFSLMGLNSTQGSLVEDLGASVISKFDTPGGILKSDAGEFLHIKLPAGMSVEDAMAKMEGDSRLEFAVPNTVYTLPEFQKSDGGITDDPDAAKLWGMNNEGQTGGKVDADIDAPEAWAVHTGRTQAEGAPILAVIDTGVDYNHPDLKDNMWTNAGEIPGNGIDDDGNGVVDDVHGYNAKDDNGDPMDGQGHGTHCAGTIAASGNNGVGVVGVNQKANIMAVKIFGDDGTTDAASIVRGIQYATANGARLTSNSWGGPMPNQAIKQAFAESDALHLVAAGNSGWNNDWLPSFPANYKLDNIVAVAATDHNDGLASFSQYGKKNVDLGAPGVDILSTVPGGGYDTYSGTSMATPHVAGAAGLIASAKPDITNAELRARLLEGTDKIESLDGKTATGGRLNVHNSLTMETPEGNFTQEPGNGNTFWEDILNKIGEHVDLG